MSAYQYQLSDAQNDIGIRNICSVCSDTVQFSDLVNRVTRRLIKRGDWFGTSQLARFCVYDCHFTTPRYVGAIRGVRACTNTNGNNSTRDNWFSIIGATRENFGCCGGMTISDEGTSPISNQLTDNTGWLLRYHVVKTTDLGKTITFYGKQYGAQPLQTFTDGAWVAGISLTSQNPFAQTTILVTDISSVVREATEGMSYLLAYNSTSGVLRNLATYQPNETNPQYRKYRVNNIGALPCHTDSNGIKYRTLECLVKLEFIPVEVATDFLLIDDFDALALGIQAIKREEAGDDQGAENKWMAAIREMNYADRNKSGLTSMKIRIPGGLVLNPV